MNLYLITQDTCRGYDTYDSAVVAAESELEAKRIYPATGGELPEGNTYDWCSSPEDVEAKFIGIAGIDIERGVILASFNAG